MTRVRNLFTAPFLILLLLGVPVLSEVVTDIAQDQGLTPHDLAYYMDQDLVAFIRPGITAKIVSATIQNNKIAVNFTVADPKGLPLDRNGVNTAGPITTSFILAYIPKGQTQYTDYVTRLVASKVNIGQNVVQAATDSGGIYTTIADGQYTYTSGLTLPASFDPAVTHTVGMTARRDLREFDLDRQSSNDVFSFVPNGSKVTVVRDVVKTESCNQCHDPLSAHGARIDTRICVLCHTPQSTDGTTGNTVDLKVMIHKIHMSKDLPSVVAGQPYAIASADFSTIGFPSDVRRCDVCHKGTTQGANYLTKPTRDACGSCHDNVNFATGENHLGGPQVSDNMCATCHWPQGEYEFDASILGAHTVPTSSTQLAGVVFSIVKLDNVAPGKQPTITFTVNDKQGNPIDITKMNSCRVTMAGPTTDYTSYKQEDMRAKATLSGNSWIYTMTNAIAADAKGSFAFGMEGYVNVTLNPGTVTALTARDAGMNVVAYASVDGSPVLKRRQVVALANCNTCHTRLMLHGGSRQNTEYCVICHNPNTLSRTTTLIPTGDSVNFKTMIHKIHTGEELLTDFTIGNTTFNEVRFPGDRRNCLKCHVGTSYNIPLPDGVISQQAPRDYINPLPPISGACLSCHTDKPTAAHASIMTSPLLGESCEACHGQNSDASIDKVHAR